MTSNQTIIITGESGSGKTQFCARVVNALRNGDLQRIDIRGVLSPGLMRNGKKVGIQAVNVVTYEHKNLAEPNRGDAGPASTKKWSFDPKVIDWCNTVLERATPCDVLVLDEIGPLEFERGEGFTAGLAAVDRGSFRLALVVVRPHLIAHALERWPGAEVLNVQGLEDHRSAVEQIAGRLSPDSTSSN